MLVVERFPDANTADVTEGVEDALRALAPGLAGITVDTSISGRPPSSSRRPTTSPSRC